MIKYSYNSAIDFLEIDPTALYDGLAYAEKNGYTALRICCLNHNDGERYILDFSDFADRLFVRKLIIGNCFLIKKILNVDALYTLRNLEYLSIDQPIKLDLLQFSNLKTLYFTGDNKLKNIGALINLRDLLMTSTTHQDLTHLENLRNLETLRICGGRITSLKGIEAFRNLERLDLLYCRKLIDVDSISKLANLKKLHIEKCVQLANFSFLQGNQTIRNLFVEKTTNLGFISSMSNLEKFSFWNCIDGNLEPLIHVPCRIYFYPNKRHYSHTLEQINKMRITNGLTS